jgi:hypothetical protein
MNSDPSAVQSKNDYEQWTARRDSSRPSPALPRRLGRASGGRYTGRSTPPGPTLSQLTALVKTRLKRMQYRPGLLGGFLASTGLDLTPFLQPPQLGISSPA